jgi:hypothetical protein
MHHGAVGRDGRRGGEVSESESSAIFSDRNVRVTDRHLYVAGQKFRLNGVLSADITEVEADPGPATWIMIVGAVMVLLGVILCRVGSDHTNLITLFAFGSLGVLSLAAGGWVWWSARAKYVLCLVSSNGPRVVFSDPNKTRVEQIAQAIRQVIGKRH